MRAAAPRAGLRGSWLPRAAAPTTGTAAGSRAAAASGLFYHTTSCRKLHGGLAVHTVARRQAAGAAAQLSALPARRFCGSAASAGDQAADAAGWHKAATRLAKAGDLDGATELYHKALTARVELLGVDDELTERTRMTLAAVYETLLDQARYPLTEDIETKINSVLNEGHPPEPEYQVGGGADVAAR
eukprot:SAG22_NODE_259_length_13477_cov_10.020407_7_plen_187_part_00